MSDEARQENQPEQGQEVEKPAKYPKFGDPRPVNLNVTIQPADHYVYSNIAGISISAWDFRINFAEINPGQDSPVVRTVAGITVPPEHAAALALLLTKQLHLFEHQFGKIRHPEWAAMRDQAIEEVEKEQEQAEAEQNQKRSEK